MRFALLVTAAPDEPMAWHALEFARAALTTGHDIIRVFFYAEGVRQANALAAPPSDEGDIVREWQSLREKHGIELVVCVAAAIRRGILDRDEAARQERQANSLAEGFVLSGLGQLVDASLEADRVLHFGSSLK